MSYIALSNVVRPCFEMFGGGMNSDLLELAVATVQAYPLGTENPGELQNRDKRIPLNVVNRRTAVHWVSSVVKRNAKTAAFCYGFYTLRNSYALKRLARDHFPAYVNGYENYGDYAAAVAVANARQETRLLYSELCVSATDR